jgi:hypothetical protein
MFGGCREVFRTSSDALRHPVFVVFDSLFREILQPRVRSMFLSKPAILAEKSRESFEEFAPNFQGTDTEKHRGNLASPVLLCVKISASLSTLKPCCGGVMLRRGVSS